MESGVSDQLEVVLPHQLLLKVPYVEVKVLPWHNLNTSSTVSKATRFSDTRPRGRSTNPS